uniref:Uncharacterized protein n=1 Tax=Bos mutus grunniens TaxID=30521 RepID=A0A8C0AJB4_BOSMU
MVGHLVNLSILTHFLPQSDCPSSRTSLWFLIPRWPCLGNLERVKEALLFSTILWNSPGSENSRGTTANKLFKLTTAFQAQNITLWL